MGSAEAPVALPNSTNLALQATATASSQSSIQPASAAIDGNVQGYPGNYSAEWSTAGEKVGAWLLLSWPQPINLTSLALYDRPNQNGALPTSYNEALPTLTTFGADWLQGGTLLFRDGSTISFGALANDGSATLVTLPGSVVTDAVLMTVTSVSPATGSIGLAEIQAYGNVCPGCTIGNNFQNSSATTQTSTGLVSGTGAYQDLALSAEAFASSAFAQQGPEKAIDGVVSGYPANSSAEWASYNEGVGAWLNITWPAYYLVDSLVLHDRPNSNDQITSAHIDLSDGTGYDIGALNNDGSAVVFNLSVPLNISSLKLTVTGVSGTTSSVGLSEIEAYYSQPQTPVNLTAVSRNPGAAAPVVGDLDNESWDDDLALQNCTATASSSAPGQGASQAINGVVNGYKEDGTGDWTQEWATVSQGAGAWINLTWPYSVKISQIGLADRPNLNDQITGAVLQFDDGSYVSTGNLYNDGTLTNISIPGIITTSIQLTVTAVSSTTSSIGLSEFAVFGSLVAACVHPSPPSSRERV